MAVSQSQIVDLLYKQAFGVTKTDTSTNKSPSNESIPSPLLNRGDTQWTQADQIPDPASAVAAAVPGIELAFNQIVSPRISSGLGIDSLLGLLLVDVSVLVTPNACLYSKSTICACDTAIISYSQFVMIERSLIAH